MNKKWGVIALSLLLAIAAKGQEFNDIISKGLEENDLSKKIPSLETLIDAAKENSPRLRFFNADQEYWSGNVDLAQRDWLRNINVEANYGYGIFDNLSNQQIAGDPGNQTLFSSEQVRYTVGLSVRMPLASVFNRKREIKNARAEADKSKFSKEYAVWELEQLVVKLYNELLRAHRMLFVANTIVETFKVQSIRAEKDYTSGVINIAEYTRLQQMLNEAISDYEAIRAEFIMAHQALEGVVGIQISF